VLLKEFEVENGSKKYTSIIDVKLLSYNVIHYKGTEHNNTHNIDIMKALSIILPAK
jgi:hypothetical protein